MSKVISASELALITHSLLVHPERQGELDTQEKYQAFMTDLAELICAHCGGHIQTPASKSDGDAWFVGINGNDSLPADGGIWKAFDPEGQLFDPCDKAPCFEQGHWYLRDEDNALFIVPDDRLGLAETYGPDDETLESLNDTYRQLEGKAKDPNWFDIVNTSYVEATLNLKFVHHWQRRFDPIFGWYTA